MKVIPYFGISFLMLVCAQFNGYSQAHDTIIVHSRTFLGNDQRNFYGNQAPNKLDTLWKLYLGEGISPAYGNPNKVWKGAGWTGQPLITEEIHNNKRETYLYQGAFDYHLKKIKASSGELVWEYRFDDILKGTGTICYNAQASSPEEKYIVIQGSRRGAKNPIDAKYCPSLRGISCITGKELWRINVKRTKTYSRDVDGSALVIGDTAYLALENGIFTLFSPFPGNVEERDGMQQAKIYKEIFYYKNEDTKTHGGNIESESSPCYLNGRVYTTAGSGRVYGYNPSLGRVDWVFEIGSDLNGSPTVTSDNCLLIPVEKQYIKGPGGVFKLDPSKPPKQSVVWYFPVADKKWFHWLGGIIGSVAINDQYVKNNSRHLAAFIGVDGFLYVVDHKSKSDSNAIGPDGKTWFATPKLIYKEAIGGTIATPILVGNKLIAPLDSGLYLYEYDAGLNFSVLDSIPNIQIDATPVCHNGKIYVASLDGYLYCFGKK